MQVSALGFRFRLEAAALDEGVVLLVGPVQGVVVGDRPGAREYGQFGVAQEALDAVRLQARQSGFDSRELHVAGSGFDWDAHTLTAKGCETAKPLLRETYRAGWSDTV